MVALELLGRRFGKLIVIGEVNRDNGLRWLAQCDCGNQKIVRGADLNLGKTKSCGCGQGDGARARTIHGLANSRFQRIWTAMRQRCQNPRASRYNLYGARGIAVCERWNDFNNFITDMYKSYLIHVKQFGEKDTSIDRIDNDGNYSPDNCKWATQKEQVGNSRKVLNSNKRRKQNGQ